MDWILMLALVTFLLVLAFLAWNKISLQRHTSTKGNAQGIGGLNDPLSGTTEGMRDPDDMRRDLDAAASSPHPASRR
jgi:hypothetical protein